MKKYIPLLFITIAIAIIVFYCLKGGNALNMPIANEITKQVPVEFPINIENNSTLNVIDGRGEYIVSKKAGENQVFNFRNDTDKTVTIEVIPEKAASNLRINKIIFPNNESDGPFGQTLTYNLRGKGLYQIEIGESLMQGEPFEGKYTLKLQLK
jgi:hypothetical protein